MASVIESNRFRSGTAVPVRAGGDGGGIVDDILKRLSALETSVAGIRVDLSAITATVPHLATKADLRSVEVSLIKWIIGTVITMTGVAFAIARFVV